MSFYASYPVAGGSGSVPTYANLAAFPSASGAGNGALAIALDTDILYISNGSIWEVLADPAGSALAITQLHGDGAATGPGNAALTLTTVNGNVGSFGTASNVGSITVNGKGLVTAASNTAIQIAESQVTNLVSDLAAKQSTTLTSAHLLVGNVSNVATDVAASGDLTLINTGAFTFNTVNGNVGTFGTASSVATITVNAKGLATAASNTAILITESQVTNLVSDLAAKQSSTLTNSHILVGNGSNVATDVAMSGDVTIANTGATTIANLAVTNAKIANTTIDLTTKVTGVLPTANGGTGQNSTATFPTSGVVVTEAASEVLTNKTISGSSNTLTVLAGTQLSGQVPIANGGTGQATANPAFNALSPLTTKGDIVGYSTVNARVPVGSDGQVLTADSTQTLGVKWAAATAITSSPQLITNYSIAASEAASALTLNLNDAAAATPSGGSPVGLNFRSSTLATGTFNLVNATAATAITIPSGATLGQVSAVSEPIYVYALNNGGTVELAVSTHIFDETQLITTTTIAAGSTSRYVMYSTTGRTGVAFRMIGRVISTQATAGTWVTAPSAIQLLPLTYQARVTGTQLTFSGFAASGNYTDITSIVLGPGKWDLSYVVFFNANGATLFNEIDTGIATASASATGWVDGENTQTTQDGTSISIVNGSHSLSNYRVSVAAGATTTYYLTILGVFSTATPRFKGRLSANFVLPDGQ